MNPTPGFRKFLIVLASIVCVVYLAYRAFFTFNLSTPYAVFASIFLYVGEAFGIMNLLLYFLQVWNVEEPTPMPVLEGRTVDVFVPTYNEDPQLLRATLEACVRMDYPHRTFLCDDGGTEARTTDPGTGAAARDRAENLKQMCADLGVIYMTRPDNRNAKAGNLNAAFEETDGEFIVVLDADHVPEPHFITRLIGYFADDRMGYVQTPHAFYNFDSFQARLDPRAKRYWEEGHLFYCVIQPGRNYWNAPIFAGSAAMFRRSALKDVGYYAVETITEDMHTGLRMNARGWRSTSITERLVAGQAAPDITTFHSQRLRWGEGNLSTMFYDNPLTMRGLALPQRLCYFASMIHWAGGVFKLAIYLTPILMLFTGVPPVSDFTPELGIVTGTYLFISLLALKIVSNGYGSIINSELFSMVNFWTQCKATYRALFRRRNQRFVVTVKRGRQAKHIWPYIRPQTYLIILSVLALFWGWGRLFLGISDDWFKPIIPTVWVLFHIALAYLAVRRAFWPVNRRFSTRHEVNLPVEYEPAAAPAGTIRYGITADLNETGMAFIGYEAMEVGTVVRFTVRGAGEVVRCKGEIRIVQKLSDQQMVHGYRCGVLFINLTPPQIDALNRICLHYAVPRLYEQYTRGNRNSFMRRMVNWSNRGGVQRRIAERYPYHLPFTVNTGDSEETATYTCTEDLSRVATAALMDNELASGTKVEYLMPTPLGDVRGQATVLRSERRQYAGQAYYRTIFNFDDFHGQGRNTVQSLVNPDYSDVMDPVLKPTQRPPLVRMGVPLLIGIMILIPLIFAMRFLAFKFVHSDDLRLKELIKRPAEIELTQAEMAEVQAISDKTLREKYPSNDRLVLLMDIMKKMNQTPELDKVTMILGTRDPKNWSLRRALADAYDNTYDYAKAEAEYKRLLEQYETGDYSLEKKKELYMAAARSSVHARSFDLAGQRFKKVLDLDPTDKTARYEYAGALISSGKFDEAEKLYRDYTPDLEARKLLVAIHIARQRYDDAEKEAKEIAQLQHKEGELLLADIQAARKNYSQSRTILEKLLVQNPQDREIELKLAQNTLANNRWTDALARYEQMLLKNDWRAEVVRGFVDAASSALSITPEQAKMATAVYDKVMSARQEDPIFLSRLGWVMQKLNELDKARSVMEKAIALNPQQPEIRQQFAGLLVTMKDYERALSFLGNETSEESQRLLVNIHIKEKNYDEAVKVARRLVDQKGEGPSGLANHMLLVDTLCLNNDFEQAIAYLKRIEKQFPQNQADISIKIAQTLLWSKDFIAAAGQLYSIIEPNFDERKNIWDDFTNALSSAPKLEENWIKLAVRIADAKSKVTNKEALPLSRLAWVLLKANRHDAAKPLLDQAVALDPKDVEVRKELSGVLAKAERYDEAIAMVKDLKLDDDEQLRVALMYAGDKKWAAAEQQVLAVLKTSPKNQKAKYLLADIASWRKDYATAIKMFEELQKEYPADTELPIRVAEIMLWDKEYDKALARFQDLFLKSPDQPKVWEGFAKSAAQAKTLGVTNLKTARAVYDKVASSDTKDPILLASTAWMAKTVQEPTRAESLAIRAIANKPADPPLRREMANILFQLGKYSEALPLLQGISLETGDRYLLIAIAGELGDADIVVEQAKILLEKEPKDRKARAAEAYGLSLKGKAQNNKAIMEQALKLYEELLSEDRKDRDLAWMVADALLSVRKFDEALFRYQALILERAEDRKLWERFIDAAASAEKELSPEQQKLALMVYDQVQTNEFTSPAHLSRLAWIMLRMGDKVRAGRAIDRAIEQAPREAKTRMEIAGVLSTLERHDAALAMFQGIAIADLDRFFYSSILASARQFQEAERELRALLKDKPDDKDTQIRYASVLTWGQKFEEARQEWEILEKRYPREKEVLTMAANNYLWGKDFPAALAKFENLLRLYPDDPSVLRGFIESVAGVDANKLTATTRQSVVGLYAKAIAEPVRNEADAAYLASLGSALSRFKERERARAAFTRAIMQSQQSNQIRSLWRRFGEALYAMDEFDDADRIFSTLLSGELPKFAPR